MTDKKTRYSASFTRRGFLRAATGAGVAAGAMAGAGRLAFGKTAPAVVTSEKMRPQLPYGIQSGDVAADRAMVWARADRPAKMFVDYSTTESFSDVRTITGGHAIDATDYTTRAELSGLPADQEIFYRLRYLDLGDLKTESAPVVGRFRTPPAARRDISFVWSGDTAGQGWGINPDFGGMKIYEVMRRQNPDFFIHCGDTIYADGPIKAEVKLKDGSVWKNIVTPEKSKVAETLNEFRGNYRYNLMDANVRRFAAEVPQIWQWDDHEVVNNWSASKDLSNDNRYKEKRVGVLVSRATRAFLEYAPLRPSASETERVYRHVPYGPLLDVFVIDMRSYRGPNSANRQSAASAETQFLGKPQIEWLKRGLLNSKATWKVIASDMPIGLQVKDGPAKFENMANGDGPPLGRELEMAGLLRFIKHSGIRNIVFVTADTHYTGAHYYDPAKAKFTDFNPFWEFMSGPLNAGSFGPNLLDNTFGIQIVYTKHPAKGQVNLPPTAGLQFFGEVKIDGKTEEMTVMLKDIAGATLHTQKLAPEKA